MTNIIFSFDTEDFTDSHTADGILEMARLLQEEGVRGCFCIVGYLARQLLAWGRTDVLEALRYHEVDFHTLGHTVHPTIGEYTDTEDYRTAYNEVIRQEAEGIAYVKAATGVSQIYAAIPPANDKSYAAMYAYADLGIPIYTDTYSDTKDARGVFFCNQLTMCYGTDLEKLPHMPEIHTPTYYDHLAERHNMIFYNHPNRLKCTESWDNINYSGENKHAFGEWEPAPRRSPEGQKAILDATRTVIRRLKQDGRFCFKTYQEIAEERFAGARILRPEDMPSIHRRLRERFYPLEQPFHLSIADVFQASVAFLQGARLFGAGRVYGFLDTPQGITAPVTVSAEAVRRAAAQLDLQTFLPTFIEVGGKRLGPADFLFAMLAVLEGEDTVTLEPRPQSIPLDDFPMLADPPILGWASRVSSFTGEYLIKRLPLQNWTIHF